MCWKNNKLNKNSLIKIKKALKFNNLGTCVYELFYSIYFDFLPSASLH